MYKEDSVSARLKKKKVIPSLFTQPTKKKTFTNLKAPMAHKTFSQEQFVFKFFFLTTSFSIDIFTERLMPNSVNKSILLLLTLRLEDIPSGTNLLFLKRFRMSIHAKDLIYFNYITYIN